MIYVCPKCLCGLKNTSEICPSCGLVFNKNDWVSESYSPKYLRSRLEIGYAGGNRFRPHGDGDFFIGANPGANGLTLPAGANMRHARVFNDTGTWKICGEEGEFFADGKKIGPGIEINLLPGMKVKIGNILLNISLRYTLPKGGNEISLNHAEFESVSLSENEISVGSRYTCRLRIKDSEPLHAKIYKKHGIWYLVNCSSAGTLLNGSRIHNAELSEGDCICVAGTRFIFTPTRLEAYRASGLSLDVENVSVNRNGKQILDRVSLQVSPGEFVGVLGPSGCGKSSLIQRIVGLDDFDSGEMKIDGNSFSECKNAFLDQSAYLPQSIALHEDLSVREETDVFCRLHQIDPSEINSKLRLVGLEDVLFKRVGDLSGGQQRRLGIALELLRRPQLLVLDEPTSGLDPKTETEVMTYLRRVASQGKTVICSTHILGNLKLFDKILLLANGRVVFFGPPENLLSKFGVKNSYALYGKLDNPNAVEYFAGKAGVGFRDATPKRTLQGRTSVNIFASGFGYLQRMCYEFLAFRNTKNRVFGFLQSALFIQVIVQPILVALAIKLSCAYKMTFDGGAKEVLFFCAISVFWLGINNTVRELVRERVPWRCLERMEQISTGGYLLAKVVWSLLLCLIQIIFLSVVIYVIPDFTIQSGGGSHEFLFTFEIFLILLITAATGALIGLAISAFFKRENAAVSLLPIVLIPILFFSQPIVTKEENKAPRLAEIITEVMPCYEPQMLMHKLNEKANDEKRGGHEAECADWQAMLAKTGLYMIFALGLMIYFQNKREREWTGR